MDLIRNEEFISFWNSHSNQLDTSGVAIVGSTNIDLTYIVEHFTKTSETQHCIEYFEALGGKGSNQCIMAGKLNQFFQHKKIIFTCCVGNDGHAQKMIQNFKDHNCYNVDFHVNRIPNKSSGIASIEVDQKSGHNRIILVGGSNDCLATEHVDKSMPEIVKHCSVLLCQLETSWETSYYAMKKAKENGLTTILNPAPAKVKLLESTDLDKVIDIITPNEEELALLSGVKVENVEDAKQACKALYEKTRIGTIIVTLGKLGCLIFKNIEFHHVETIKLEKVVDTTGAGDAFCGSLAFFISSQVDLITSCKFACYLASMSTLRKGAQLSYPPLQELLGGQKK